MRSEATSVDDYLAEVPSARRAVLDAHRPEFAGADLGKGCVRFRRPDQIDMDLVETVLRETAASHGPTC